MKETWNEYTGCLFSENCGIEKLWELESLKGWGEDFTNQVLPILNFTWDTCRIGVHTRYETNSSAAELQ